MLAAFMKISRFAAGFNLAQAGKAACAAAVAFLASSIDADDDCQICLCEEGEVTENVVSVVTSFPLMRRGTVYEASAAIVERRNVSNRLRGTIDVKFLTCSTQQKMRRRGELQGQTLGRSNFFDGDISHRHCRIVEAAGPFGRSGRGVGGTCVQTNSGASKKHHRQVSVEIHSL